MPDPAGVAASVIPQLSIGVVAVLSFAVSIYFFIRHLEKLSHLAQEERQAAAIAAAKERELAAIERTQQMMKIEEHHQAVRTLERELRDMLVGSIQEAANQLKENTHILTRVIDWVDQPTVRVPERPTKSFPSR
jgi:uncharacterized membrane protein YcjF (UPF0283 family)